MGEKKIPLYLRLYREMRGRIEAGTWPAGTRLLSIREQAATLGVSKFTVERVYGQLAAEGYIAPHNRSRYEVQKLAAVVRDVPQRPPETPVRPMYRYDFRSAGMDPAGFDFVAWRRYFYRVWKQKERLLSYGDERGEYELRLALARYGATARDTRAGAESIVIGSSTQQLLRILARLLREDHHRILFAEEIFPLGAQTFADEGYEVETVPELGSFLARDEGARLLYVVPSLAYSSGRVMPARVRAELLAWSERRDGILIEDDFDSELSYYGRPISSLQGMGDGRRVVYIGALSRVLPPSFRIAYMILPPALSVRYEARRHLHRQTVSIAEQLALADYIGRGALQKQIRRLRKLYRYKGEALTAQVERVFGAKATVTGPVAGLYLRVRLALAVTPERLDQALQAAGIALRIEGASPDGICVWLAFSRLPENDFPAAVRALYEVTEALAREEEDG